MKVSLVFLVFTVFMSCNPAEIGMKEELRVYEGTLQGRIVNENNMPLGNAKVIVIKKYSVGDCFDYASFQDSCLTQNNGEFKLNIRQGAGRWNPSPDCSGLSNKVFMDSVFISFKKIGYEKKVIKKNAWFYLQRRSNVDQVNRDDLKKYASTDIGIIKLKRVNN